MHTRSYMLSVVDKLIVENYIIVYLHSGAPKRSMPSVPVLHKLYRMIDRRFVGGRGLLDHTLLGKYRTLGC